MQSENTFWLVLLIHFFLFLVQCECICLMPHRKNVFTTWSALSITTNYWKIHCKYICVCLTSINNCCHNSIYTLSAPCFWHMFARADGVYTEHGWWCARSISVWLWQLKKEYGAARYTKHHTIKQLISTVASVYKLLVDRPCSGSRS